MSLNAALSIADSSLAAINIQLGLASHNVANASTPGYATENAGTQSMSAGGIGMGVRTAPASRDVDQALQSALLRQNATTAGLSTTSSAMSAIDTVQGAPGQGQDLASLFGNVEDAFSTLLNDPSNGTQQSAVVSAAGALAAGINTLSNAYTVQRQNSQNAIVTEVGTVNAALSTIGSLSDQIVAAKAQGQSTADLENQRDGAITSLSQIVGVNVLGQANGDVLLMTASGITLPIHGPVNPLSTSGVTISPTSSYPGGIPAITLGGADVTSGLRGGQIGANIALRDSTLPTYQAELDEFSQNLAAGFAAQGLPLFTDAAGTVPAGGGAPVQSGYVGFAAQIQVNPAIAANSGAVRDGLPSANASNLAGFPDVIEAVLGNVLGNAPVAGGHTAGLGSTGTLNAPFSTPATLAGFATDIVASQAADSSAASSRLTTEQSVQTSLQTRLSAETGVDMDTEMTNLIALQNAYSANAKVISAVQGMFSALLGMVNP